MTDTVGQAEVVLYVVPGCPLCADARKLLSARGVKYIERDVANDFGALRRMYKLTRQNLVPVVAISDRAIVRPSEIELMEFFAQ